MAVVISTKAVGNIVKLRENGALADYIIVHQGLPSGAYDGSCSGAWLLRKDILEIRQFNDTAVDNYSTSTIHNYLNSVFLNTLDVKNSVKQVKIPYRHGGYGTYVRDGANGLPCKAFLLSLYEVGETFGGSEGFAKEGTNLAFFQGNNTRIAYYNGNASDWWIRTPATNTTGEKSPMKVRADGVAYGWRFASYAEGIRPALIVPSSVWIADDGTLATNIAPTTPSSISLPSTIKGGTSITVSWGVASDADGNLSGYRLERSVNGGTWSQVYQGTALSSSQAITKGWNTVAFRVKAYDSIGEESGYRASSAVTVINNTAPTVPASITVPSTIKGGTSITVSWAASSDEDGNLSGYRLERSVNNGAWSQVYEGSALTSVQAITKGWITVAYRVKAYDAGGLESGYRAGSAVTVINNTPPTAPANISYSAPQAGKAITLTCATSTDVDGNPITYIWERLVDSGAYTQIGATSATTFTDTVPTSGEIYQARVKAADDQGGESAYTTGEALAIDYNTPPVISGSDEDLGSFDNPPEYTYIVTDADAWQTLKVSEKIGDITIREYEAVAGETNTVNFTKVWIRLAKGPHTLRITVSDGAGGTAVRTITFARNVNRVAVSRTTPTEQLVTRALFSVFPPNQPEGTVLHAEACNNPFDDAPAWEDITSKLGKTVHLFNNAQVANGSGIGYRVSIRPGSEASEPVKFEAMYIRYASGEDRLTAAENAVMAIMLGGAAQ
ncbi:DUF6273 domain-containing protein [Oscillospiraceae bacterium MB08-C2-2]|nr:DUF6273 domain-containing protein [Oscillospiraceae bacterium MB08-C2-2]